MIGWLRGEVRLIQPEGGLLLDVNGVGYELAVSMQTLCQMQLGKQVELFVHTHLREDQLSLFGFGSMPERALFRKLLAISGIGAKSALNILSTLSVAEFMRALDGSDATMIARAPGIGIKTAKRLILELRGQLAVDSDGVAPASGVVADVRSALINLGYKPASVDAALQQTGGSSTEFETLFKATLKVLA